MSLCEACNSFTIHSLTQELTDPPPWWLAVNKSSHGKLHKPDARHFLESAKTCPLCKLMKEAIVACARTKKLSNHLRFLTLESGRESDLGDIDARLWNQPVCLRAKREHSETAFPSDDVEGAKYLRGFAVVMHMAGELLTGLVRLYAHADSEAAHSGDVVCRPPLSSPDSDEAHSLVGQWVASCRRQHRKCKESLSREMIESSQPPQLPTRVIDVGLPDGSTHPRLVESLGRRGNYFALSHCWGPPELHPLMTTKETLASHQTGIKWYSIPKVYQDAIIVTRRQRVQFLWVDSLCIIQDDHADWLAESAKMAEVYERAELVIAASHAADTTEGCFFERPPLPEPVEIPYRNENGGISGLIYATAMDNDYTDISPEFGVLNRRAWATQEWLLARRIVFYTKRNLVWSCKCITVRENGASFHSTGRNTKWKFIVEKYSARLLTKASDKLIALEGVRSALEKKLGDEYLHGLWKKALPDQLLWYCGRDAERSRCELDIPSWTWASTMCGVRFLKTNMANISCKTSVFDGGKGLAITGRFEKVVLQRGFPKPFNATTSAIARERETSFHAELRWALPRINGYAIALENGFVIGNAILDEPEEDDFPALMVVLMRKIYREKTSETSGETVWKKFQEDYVMLLRPYSSTNLFVRIGVGRQFWEQTSKTRGTREFMIL